MAAVKQSGSYTLAQIIALAVVGLHAVLVPALYFSIAHSVQTNHADFFTNHVRAYSHTLAEELESGYLEADDNALQNFLDGLALGGEVAYVEFDRGDRVFRSELLPPPGGAAHPTEDFTFGGGKDRIYHLSLSMIARDHPATLRLGFDEAPTLESIASTLRGVLLSLAAYSIAVLGAAWILSRRVSRPLRELQADSRRVAMGEHPLPLHARSTIREIIDLTSDLNTMRTALLGLNAQLAARMVEQQMLERRLRQKRRLETVGTLAGGLAHEFNNVLVPITLFSEIALEKISPDHAAHEDVQRVLISARRAINVTGKVLTFSRVGHSHSTAATDLTHAVQEAINLFRVSMPANISLDLHLEEDCWLATGDETLIVQIVLNLCTNGAQAMPEGGELVVTTRNTEVADHNTLGLKAGPYVELSVSDTGHGMDAETLERIYEPFFTSREVGKGTGLGLSVVHGIVTALQGSIRVQSEPGRGTVFQVLFPTTTPDTDDSGGADANDTVD